MTSRCLWHDCFHRMTTGTDDTLTSYTTSPKFSFSSVKYDHAGRLTKELKDLLGFKKSISRYIHFARDNTKPLNCVGGIHETISYYFMTLPMMKAYIETPSPAPCLSIPARNPIFTAPQSTKPLLPPSKHQYRQIMADQTLPQDHRALVLTSTSPHPTVQTLPTPKPGPGSAVVRILAANVISYMRQIYNGERQYPFPTPLIPGTNAVGRVAAAGPDATLLKPGVLVLVDCTIRGRDDATAVFLGGIHEGYTEGSRTLMRGSGKIVRMRNTPRCRWRHARSLMRESCVARWGMRSRI